MDARTNNSRKKIIQSGLKLFIQNEDSTLVDVAKRAEVGRATVYRQFKHKEALQEEIALYCLDRFDEVNMSVENKAKDSLDAIRLVFENTLPLYEEFAFLQKFEKMFQKSEKLQVRMQQQDNEIRELIKLAKDEGLLSKHFCVDWGFYFFEGLLYAGYKMSHLDNYSSGKAAHLAFLSFKSGVAS